MPIPHGPNGGQTALEAAAIAARTRLIPNNVFNNAAPANQYSATHTRALADTLTPTRGKGTGNFLDINNYNAGDDYDINGNPTVSIGGGRKNLLGVNLNTWGYDPSNNYLYPNTAANVGQVHI